MMMIRFSLRFTSLTLVSNSSPMRIPVRSNTRIMAQSRDLIDDGQELLGYPPGLGLGAGPPAP